ncbi:sensor histidine kinase [Acidisoma sp. 7E03]
MAGAGRPLPLGGKIAVHSLRARLFGLWLLSLTAGVAVAVLLGELYQQSVDARIGRAQLVVSHGCDLIKDRYSFFTARWAGAPPDLSDPRFRTSLANVVGLALTNLKGVEGGIWQSRAGPLAYAFPTYEGSGPKTDLPAAELGQIKAVNEEAARTLQPAKRQRASRAQTLLLDACPLLGPVDGLTAWTMTRVNAAPGFWPLLLGLGVLLALQLGMAAWLGRTLLIWGRHVRAIETSLADTSQRHLPAVPLTGERELDRIVGALNDAGRRLAAARREAEEMAERVAASEHLAGLGRVAAGVAHEIRNPIAAARLQGENALAGSDERRREAIGEMLSQLDRLDMLVTELLAMTQRAVPRPEHLALPAFLAECLSRHEAIAAQRQVTLALSGAEGTAVFDPMMIGRVLDNLLGNAVRHSRGGGVVTLSVERDAGRLTILVQDSGEGIAPDLAPRLFEPFVTGRADGTGLGLAIARQLADAHGGHLRLRRAGGAVPGQGAIFALELLCPPS